MAEKPEKRGETVALSSVRVDTSPISRLGKPTGEVAFGVDGC
jgi:hypothetical protein